MDEHVILVDEQNTPIGTRSKYEVHGEQTPLHRGFSVFLFDRSGRFLIQQRSAVKQTWPLVWSNSCCGHPQQGETLLQAAERRLAQELRLKDCQLYEVLPDYRYQAVFDGVMENEYCPVCVGWTSSEPDPDESEVAATKWIDWQEFLQGIIQKESHPYQQFSQWSREEAVLLNESEYFHELWQQHVSA
jgi:isopentenyl-diphosphate delta-isomerase